MSTKPHRYESCRDADCPLPYCRIAKEMRAEGYQEAKDDFFMPRYELGFAEGTAAGYSAGVAAAQSSCSCG